MSVISDVIQSTVAVLKGMRRTLSEIPREKWTVQYPDDPVTLQPRYRGQHLLHVDENGLSMLRLLETTGLIDKSLAEKQAAEYESDIKKYQARSAETMAKAKALEAEYDRLNFRDDQFDMSDAFLSITLALAAIAALVDAYWLLFVAWASGAFGLLIGIAGFLGYGLRPEWLASLLGT